MRNLGNTGEEIRRNAPESVVRYLDGLLHDDAYGWPNTDDFEADFGGGCYLVETDEDLAEIETLSWSYRPGDNRYLNLSEIAAPFDVAEWIPSGEYVNIFLATNNAGGNTYFIPREIAERNETVLESIAMTQEENSDAGDEKEPD